MLRHASAYGVRIVPGIDVPGHAFSWSGHTAHCPRTAAADAGRFSPVLSGGSGPGSVKGKAAWGHSLDISKPATVVPDRYRSPHHRMPFDPRNHKRRIVVRWRGGQGGNLVPPHTR